MSATSNNNVRSNISPNRFFSRIANSYIHSDSINQAPTTPYPVDNDNAQSSTWVDSITQLDRVFSGTLLRLFYIIIDTVLLSLGLYYTRQTCSTSNALAIVSICILVFTGLELACIFLFLIRNWHLRHMSMSDPASSNQYNKGYRLRAFFHFLRFICTCVGTVYVFTSKIPINNNCEILRFCLGIVCFNTWILVFNWPPKPTLPGRRSMIIECVILILPIIFHSIYVISVIFPVIKTKNSECIYTNIEDLYFHAPLKSYAYVGLILSACIIGNNIVSSILNQLYYRYPNSRRIFVQLWAIEYIITYLTTIIFVYYLSVGSVLLFQPRSGDLCRTVAPNLYKTLLIWQFIRVFLPIIIWPVLFLVCCLGVIFGACLAVCLPASITVPLLEMIRARLPNIPTTSHPDPPASPGTIEALPVVGFGQVADEFNQTECSICRSDYEANEQVKKLPCGHLFHAPCVANWLLITRICPVCRQRIPTGNL